MEMKEPIPYKEAFPEGTRVRVADRIFLEQFMAEWKYHHKLRPDQLPYADRETRVKAVAFYHGGDPIYTLEDVPGLWLEQCLCISRSQI
jgi:hypothetical protein